MKHLVLISLFIGIATCCMAQKNNVQEPLPTYELYSWKGDAGSWDFSILQTTSRMKTPEEIFGRQRTIHGLNKLKQEISRLVRPSRIVWIENLVYEGTPVKGTERLTLPPKEIIEEVKHYAAVRSVEVLGSE